jgi:hypothetical protein
MSRSPLTFRQNDVSRLVKAATAAGLCVSRVRVDTRSGTIEVMTGALRGQDLPAAREQNEWDTVMVQ